MITSKDIFLNFLQLFFLSGNIKFEKFVFEIKNIITGNKKPLAKYKFE